MKKSLLRKIIRSTIIESFIKEGHCYDEDGKPMPEAHCYEEDVNESGHTVNVFDNPPPGAGGGPNWQTAANDKKFNYVIAHAYPHNLFFELTNEYGVLAGLLFLFLILHIFYLSFIKMKKNRSNITSLYPLLFYALIFLFLNTMLSGDLMDGRILFVFISLVLINKPLVTDEK